MKLDLKTPAKINLGLKIIGKRQDGYHELETLMQMVGLYDTLSVETGFEGSVTLKCDQPDIPSDNTNLAHRAAELLKNTQEKARNQGCRIHLKKQIPAGGGLGGGSGNAAGVLLALNHLWELGLSKETLIELASQLGSDVPFFLFAPSALGRGRGEKLTPVSPANKFYVIMVFPKFAIPTKEIYQAYKLELTQKQNNISILCDFFSRSDIVNLGQNLSNDLEKVVFEKYPDLETLKDALMTHGANGSLLSGSGSVVFGVFDHFDVALSAFEQLKQEDREVFLAPTISDFHDFLPRSLSETK